MLKGDPVVVVSGTRVPQSRQNRALANARPAELAALVARRAVCDSRVPLDAFEHAFWGVMYQTEGSSIHLAKQTATAAGLAETVPALLVNRLCGSGLEAVVQGARAIHAGEARAVLAGSTDTMSRSASISLSSKQELGPFHEDPILDSTMDPGSGKRIGQLADESARDHNIERHRLDQFSFASRENARRAQATGRFESEVTAVPASILRTDQWGTTLCHDQLEARWTSLEDLAALESPYGNEGRITRGNTSAFADGAAAFTLTSRSLAQAFGCKILGTIRSAGITAAASNRMGDALVRAIELCIRRAGIQLAQIDWFELEEAFAVNCIHAISALGLPMEKVNPNGGALALGHPPATSGLRLLLSAISGLRQNQCRFSLIALVAGGSQGMAMLIENPA